MPPFNWKFVSLGTKFPRKLTPDADRIRGPFRKTWGQVLDDLRFETEKLLARDDSVVIQTFHDERDVRANGQLRADARQPRWPGVVVRFDVPSDDLKAWTPMSFECDQYSTWQSNVQAIAGALEALRKVDRYGVSSRGKDKAHYTGYKALPSAEGKTSSRQAAAEFISRHSGVPIKEILFSNTALSSAYRKAASKLHPDKTGNTEEFAKLTEARSTLETVTEAASAAGGNA